MNLHQVLLLWDSEPFTNKETCDLTIICLMAVTRFYALHIMYFLLYSHGTAYMHSVMAIANDLEPDLYQDIATHQAAQRISGMPQGHAIWRDHFCLQTSNLHETYMYAISHSAHNVYTWGSLSRDAIKIYSSFSQKPCKRLVLWLLSDISMQITITPPPPPPPGQNGCKRLDNILQCNIVNENWLVQKSLLKFVSYL